MCGISGIYNSKGLAGEDEVSIKRMTASLLHRGPDGAGIYIDDNAALGHTRLSILDPAGGDQPMFTQDGRLWIVFNGEIFNYPELKSELLKSGYNFKTGTDTEVLLYLFKEKKESCLNHLNGQFAFAVWDNISGELFLARDRVGIVPLFYTAAADGSFLFSSEIKGLFASGKVERQIDINALSQIITFWTCLPGKTAFKNIYSLPPGCYMKINGRNSLRRRYWNINFDDTGSELNYDKIEIAGRLDELITDAVKIRLRADVPVGGYLSGGLDSSGIAGIIKHNFQNNFRTFSIGFEDEGYDERDYQRYAASYLRADRTEEMISNNYIIEKFTEIIKYAESPILRTAPVPMYKLSKKVREAGYKTVLSGEGADEIFGGYNIFKETLIRNYWSKEPSSAARGMLLSRLYPYVFKDQRLKNSITEFFKYGIEDTADPFFSHRIRWRNTSRILNLLNPGAASSAKMNAEEELLSILPEDFSRFSPLGKAQYLEMILFMSGYLLSSQGDRMAMANSVELRVPFLDHRIIEYMSAIPYSLKIRGLMEKLLLKQVFKKYLPAEILNRAKTPFRAPNLLLFKGKAAEKNIAFTTAESIKEAGLFDKSKIQLLIKKINSGSGSETDGMAGAAVLSSQALYYTFIKDYKNPGIIPINLYYDKRKRSEKLI